MDQDYYREAITEAIRRYEMEEDLDEYNPSDYIKGLLIALKKVPWERPVPKEESSSSEEEEEVKEPVEVVNKEDDDSSDSEDEK